MEADGKPCAYAITSTQLLSSQRRRFAQQEAPEMFSKARAVTSLKISLNQANSIFNLVSGIIRKVFIVNKGVEEDDRNFMGEWMRQGV